MQEYQRRSRSVPRRPHRESRCRPNPNISTGTLGPSLAFRTRCRVIFELDHPPQFDSSLGSAIPLLAAVATGEVCWLYGVKVQLKWPNDVLFEKRKLAGILCEARGTPDRWSAIVGIGLNLKRPANGWPTDIPAIALDEVSDGDINREDIAYALTERLDYWVSRRKTWPGARPFCMD